MATHNPLTRDKKRKALALLQHNQPGEALPLLEQVCRINRRDTGARFMLAAAHQTLGAFEQAADAYRQVIAHRPDHADAYYYLGNTYLALGNGPAAVDSFEQAIRLRPDYLEAHVNLGALFELQHNHTAAEASLRQALRLNPENAELHYSLGNILQSQGKHEAAIDTYRKALALRPDHPDTHNNLGNALAQLDHLDEAIRCYQEALRIQPNLAAAYNNMGNTHAKQRRFDEALANYQQALVVNPRYAEAQTNLGNIQRYQGNLADAIASHRRAIEFDSEHADAHFNLAFALLVVGEFHEGWREYAWHWKREGANPRPFAPSVWDGADLGGRSVFLHAEQGLGDELFFLRFVPELKCRGAGHIAYRPSKKITALLACTSIIDRLLEPTATPTADDWVFSIGDLPRLLDMAHGSQIPLPISLAPRADKIEIMRHRLAEAGPPPYMGVTWHAGTMGKEMALHKTSPHALLAETLRTVPATILILQRLPAEDEIKTFRERLGRPAHDFSALNNDLEAMLALLALIDDYIGVSNTNMHLRAGVGKTARVLVPSPPEWRWMAEGKESPWFPGFRVYRQGYDGNWGEAFAQLEEEL